MQERVSVCVSRADAFNSDHSRLADPRISEGRALSLRLALRTADLVVDEAVAAAEDFPSRVWIMVGSGVGVVRVFAVSKVEGVLLVCGVSR